tara:strand:+ start:17633 stop:17824 length:192 start_codon:yes stop_codon:yes gene_type:complete
MPKLMTNAELVTKSAPELRSLYRITFNELARSKSGTAERRTALASLEKISRALAHTSVCNLEI